MTSVGPVLDHWWSTTNGGRKAITGCSARGLCNDNVLQSPSNHNVLQRRGQYNLLHSYQVKGPSIMRLENNFNLPILLELHVCKLLRVCKATSDFGSMFSIEYYGPLWLHVSRATKKDRVTLKAALDS